MKTIIFLAVALTVTSCTSHRQMQTSENVHITDTAALTVTHRAEILSTAEAIHMLQIDSPEIIIERPDSVRITLRARRATHHGHTSAQKLLTDSSLIQSQTSKNLTTNLRQQSSTGSNPFPALLLTLVAVVLLVWMVTKPRKLL